MAFASANRSVFGLEIDYDRLEYKLDSDQRSQRNEYSL